MFCDPYKLQPLSNCLPGLADEPTEELDTKEPSWKEVNEVVKHSRAASAPGPSGIPYKVYKKCPKLLRRLWKLIRKIWTKGSIPLGWRRAEGCFIPKEAAASKVSQFRTISLLSVEGKIFFSVLAKRLTHYMTANGYLNTSIQKGGIPGFSGCLEHTGLLSQLILEAKQGKGNLAVVWLDLSNAYGSIPHSLIQTAMDYYHIPPSVTKIITNYFNDIKLRFQAANFLTEWQSLEKGIATGCTISPILFLMGMNLFITAASNEAKGPKTSTGA